MDPLLSNVEQERRRHEEDNSTCLPLNKLVEFTLTIL